MFRMFRVLVIVAALLPIYSAVPAHAQGVGVGMKGGYLYTSFDFDGVSDVLDSSNGWMAGLFFGGNRPGTVGLMGEINVQAKRGELGAESRTIYYLRVPALLRVNVGSRSTGGVSAYGIAGPALDLKVGEDLGNFTNIDEIESVDVSLVAGIGVEITRLIIEGRGTWGFRNIAKQSSAGDVKTRTFAILLGLLFN